MPQQQYNFTTPAKREKRASTALSETELEQLTCILEYRKRKGRSTDLAQLIRQCIEFALNSQWDPDSFDVPPIHQLHNYIPVNEPVNDPANV